MTMGEALDHEWLAGPSSQTSESQRQKLGGDSMWSIESFDEEGYLARTENPDDQWTRLTTESGTRGESEESFSQPMGNLRIEVLTARRGGLPATPRNERYLDEEIDEGSRSLRAVSRGPLDACLPSPPLTDDKSIDPDRLEARTNERPTPLPQSETPRTAAALKRKVESIEFSTGHSHAMFSSGSLSPAPESEEDVGTPGNKNGSTLHTAQTPGEPLEMKVRLIRDAEWTESDGILQAAIPVVPDGHTAARRSTRASTGLRKSMRLY